MIDIDKLRQALGAVQPEEVLELIDRIEAAEKERDKYKTAYNEWCEKSEWIQEGINNREISPKYLGWHLADIALDLLNGHKEMCVALQAKIEQMERQEPVMWANSSNINSSRINKERGGSGDQHTCSETQTEYHHTPLYTLPGARGEEK